MISVLPPQSDFIRGEKLHQIVYWFNIWEFHLCFERSSAHFCINRSCNEIISMSSLQRISMWFCRLFRCDFAVYFDVNIAKDKPITSTTRTSTSRLNNQKSSRTSLIFLSCHVTVRYFLYDCSVFFVYYISCPINVQTESGSCAASPGGGWSIMEGRSR